MPELPKDYGSLDVQGSVILKVEFLPNGLVGKVLPITRMPMRNLTELAVEAARKIEFEAEIKDGNAVETFKLVQYSYSWNGFWKTPSVLAQGENRQTKTDALAEAVLQKAIQNLGGEKYLNVKTQIGRGKYSVIRDNVVISFQAFIDTIVFPDKERTEFKGGGVRSVQTNTGNTGWVFDGDQDLIKVQDEKQVDNFKHGIRVSLDNLLRGHWRKDGTLSYIGKRPATLGKRNEVVKLTYSDGLIVEFEFAADDGLPVKAVYKRLSPDNEEIKEEDRYAQFLDFGGIKSPFIIDHFMNGMQSSRINYESIEFNKSVPESIFAKPSNPKELKKNLNL